jgi:hypothetical protein
MKIREKIKKGKVLKLRQLAWKNEDQKLDVLRELKINECVRQSNFKNSI